MLTGRDAGWATIRRTTIWTTKKAAASRLKVLRRLNLRSFPCISTGTGPAEAGMLVLALSTPPRITPEAAAGGSAGPGRTFRRMKTSLIPTSRLFASLLLVPVIALVFTACGGSDEATPQNEGNGSGMVGGMVECDASSIQDGVDAWAKAFGGGEKTTLPDDASAYRCADGWAVAFPETGPKDVAVTVTVVLEAEGQFWIPKDRSKVCGETAADSQVPESLFRDACQTN